MGPNWKPMGKPKGSPNGTPTRIHNGKTEWEPNEETEGGDRRGNLHRHISGNISVNLLGDLRVEPTGEHKGKLTWETRLGT